MTLEKTTLDACSKLLRQHWPTLGELPPEVVNVALTRIQQVLETEGLAAITPERISGWQELTEEHLVPMHAFHQAQLNHSTATEPPAAT